MTRRARWALALAVLALLSLGPSSAARAEGLALPRLELDLGGGDRVRAQLAAQLRASATGGEDAATEGTIALPRVRPGLRATLLERRLAVALTLNTSPSALELIDLWVEGVVEPGLLRVRAGQWKVPFTRYRSLSFTELSFVDWARTVTVPFGAEHAIGVAAAGVLPGWGTEWDLGVFAGEPTRAAQGTGLASTYRERVPNLSELGSLGLVDGVHPELVGRVTQRLGAAGGDRVELTLSVAGDLAPEPRRDLALRVAPELYARAGSSSGRVVLYAGFAELSGDPLAPALFGVLAELAVTPLPALELALRYARTARTAGLRADARRFAEQLVGGSSAEEREAALARAAEIGREDAEQELALGATWRVLGPGLQLQGDAAWLTSEGARGASHGFRLRLQAQLVL